MVGIIYRTHRIFKKHLFKTLEIIGFSKAVNPLNVNTARSSLVPLLGNLTLERDNVADMFDRRAVKPMLISERSDPFDNPGHIFELKMDGERCIAYLDPLAGTDLRNKSNAMLLPHVPELSEIHKLVNTRCILDGELIVTVDGQPNFFEIQRRTLTTDRFKIQLQSSRLPATFVAFDILYHGSQETTSLSVIQRKELLQKTVLQESETLAISRYI